MRRGETPADALVRAWLADAALPEIEKQSAGSNDSDSDDNSSRFRSRSAGRSPAGLPWSPSDVEQALEGARAGAVDDLARQLVVDVGTPADERAVAALLESRGLNDTDARTQYHRSDIFDLAHEVHKSCMAPAGEEFAIRPSPNAPSPQDDDREVQWRRSFARFVRYYLRGLFFALPLAVQVACLMAFGYGSWASVHFTTREATTVALATICSFIAAGGVAQIIARMGNFYIEQHNFVLARRVMYRIGLYGFAAAMIAGAGLAVIGKVAGILPAADLADALVYYVLLLLLFLSLAVLQTLQQRLAIMVTMVANLALVVGLISGLTIATKQAHWAGLLAWSLLALGWGQVVLRRRAVVAGGKSAGHTLIWAPKLRIMAFTTWRHFGYGLVYFMFLFADRIIAWTAESGAGVVVFRSNYEVGLDWALMSLILTIAMLEYTVRDLAALVPPVQRRTAANQRDALNRAFRRLYLRHLVMLVVVAAVSVNLTYFVAISLAESIPGLAIHAIVSDPVAASVFEISAAAYSLLAICLLNTVLFFSVARPSMALWPLVTALVVDVAVGTFLSRSGEWWWAVGGLLAGVVVFTVISTTLSVKVFRRLDYYYYSA